METNVGSPPCVSRTSPALRSDRRARPARRSPPIARRVYGRVTRGSSWMRVTLIATLNSTFATSVSPEIGAALPGVAVHASGMWPSPARRPDVGSRPIHPAPGTYASAHACRSVKSRSAPGRTVERLHVGDELNQVAGRETRGDTRGGAGSARAASPSRGTIRSPSPASPRASARPAPCAPDTRLVLDALVDRYQQVDRRVGRPRSSRGTARSTPAAGRLRRRPRGTVRAPARGSANTRTETPRRTARRKSRTD